MDFPCRNVVSNYSWKHFFFSFSPHCAVCLYFKTEKNVAHFFQRGREEPDAARRAATRTIDLRCELYFPSTLGRAAQPVLFSTPPAAWSFSVSELAAPGVEVGRLTAADPDLGDNAQLEFTIMDSEEAEIFNLTGRDKEAVIVLSKVSDEASETAASSSQENIKERHISVGLV